MVYYSHILLTYYFLLFLSTFPLALFCFPAGPVPTFTSIFSSWDMVSFRTSWRNLNNSVKFLNLSITSLLTKRNLGLSFHFNRICCPLTQQQQYSLTQKLHGIQGILIHTQCSLPPKPESIIIVMITSFFSFGNWICSAWKMKMSPRWTVILKVGM